MPHIHFISGASSLRLRNLIHPRKDELDLGLACAVSGGGDVYVSRKSAPSLVLTRQFAGVRDEDYAELRNWYATVSEGPRNAFVCIDADGTSRTVRWMNGLDDWQRDSENRWSGSLKLRVENFEV